MWPNTWPMCTSGLFLSENVRIPPFQVIVAMSRRCSLLWCLFVGIPTIYFCWDALGFWDASLTPGSFFFFFSLSILQPKKGKFCHSYWSQAEGISFSRTLPRQLFSQGGLSFFLSCFLLGFHLCSLLWFNSSNSWGLILAR